MIQHIMMNNFHFLSFHCHWSKSYSIFPYHNDIYKFVVMWTLVSFRKKWKWCSYFWHLYNIAVGFLRLSVCRKINIGGLCWKVCLISVWNLPHFIQNFAHGEMDSIALKVRHSSLVFFEICWQLQVIPDPWKWKSRHAWNHWIKSAISFHGKKYLFLFFWFGITTIGGWWKKEDKEERTFLESWLSFIV